MLRRLIFFTVFCVGKAQECPQINIFCSDIKTDNGFKFSYDCPQPSQGGWTIEVTDDETKIAQAPPFVHSPQVISFDDSSITTGECRGLHVKCIVRGEQVKESCWELKIAEEVTSPDPSHSPTPQDSPSGGSLMKVPPWVIVAIVVILLIGIIMITVMLCLRKKKVKKWFSYQLACLRPKTSQAVRTVEETGEPLSALDSRDDNHPDDTLESVCADSIDPAPDGETPQSFSPDRTPSNGRIQESKNGDRSAPDVNGAYNHLDIRRYMRDDPGGYDNKGKGVLGNREMRNGWGVGDRGPEDENGGQPLLLNPRAAIQDKTGETVSVYEHSFGTERVRGCSTSLDADVESTANTKNIKTQ